MLVKLATQLLSLKFVDAKQCGTVHAQSKTSMRGQKMARVLLVYRSARKAIWKLAANKNATFN